MKRSLLTAACCALLAAPSFAHVYLSNPQGGEVMQAGSTFTIEFYELVHHGPQATYNLFYSVDGGASWQTIVTDLPYTDGTDTYDWTVPNYDTGLAMVRVEQITHDQFGTMYEDMSAFFDIVGDFRPYGTATDWNGLTPVLHALGTPVTNSTVTFQVHDAEPGAMVHWIAGPSQTNTMQFGVTLLTTDSFAHELGFVNGAGSVSLFANLPSTTIGLTVHVQAVIESTPASATRGLRFTVQ